MSVYVQCESSGSSTGYNASPFDDGPYSGYSHEIDHYSGVKVFEYTDRVEGRIGYHTKKFDVDAKAGDIVFVVVAVYTTGGTFGCTEGNPSVLGVFKDVQAAVRLRDFVQKDYDDYRKGVGDRYNWQLEFEGTEVYAEWKGYFESLDGLHIETEVVRP